AWNADGSAVLPVSEAAQSCLERGIPLVVFAGINYGAGSSRDWAAKAPALLGVRAVVARSFERIHFSNLIGMGVFPIESAPGDSVPARLSGEESITVLGLDELVVGPNDVTLVISHSDGPAKQ